MDPLAIQESRSFCATLAAGSHLLEIEIRVNGLQVTAFVDSGCQGNYASPSWVNRFKIPWVRKTNPYQLVNFEGETMGYDGGTIKRETEVLNLTVSGKRERIVFDILEVPGHDIVLGIPWLRSSNPVIDWTTGQLRWEPTNSSPQGTIDTATRRPANLQPYGRTRSGSPTRMVAFVKKLQEPSSDGGQLPKEYAKYATIFKEELETGLPEHSR